MTLVKNSNAPNLSLFASLISICFHPLLICSYLILIISFYLPSLLSPWTNDGRYMLLWIVFTGTFLIPLIFIFLFFNKRDQTTTELLLMREGKSRTQPFLLTACCYIFLSLVLYKQLRINYIIVAILITIALAIAMTGIVSRWWKISAHAVGIGSALGFLLMLNQWLADGDLFIIILVATLLSGVLLSARLYLNEHQPLEVFVGWIGGVVLGVGSMLIII